MMTAILGPCRNRPCVLGCLKEVHMAEATASTNTSLVSRLRQDLARDPDGLGASSDELQDTMEQVVAYLDSLAVALNHQPQDYLPIYSWWFGALGKRNLDNYREIATYVPWLWLFDAIALVDPSAIYDALSQDLDDMVAGLGGPRFLLTDTGKVSRQPDLLASLIWGSESTIGETFPGWTIRRIARWYVALVLSDGYAELAKIPMDQADRLGQSIMRRAIERDPEGTVKDQESQRDFLRTIMGLSEQVGDETASKLAAEQRKALEVGDPQSNAAVAVSVVTAPMVVAREAEQKIEDLLQKIEDLADPSKSWAPFVFVGLGIAAAAYGISQSTPRRRS